MTEPRLLVIMGSGETTPTMVSTHQRVFARLGADIDARVLDTPYGFQENASEVTERTLSYLRHNVGREARAVSLRRTSDLPPAALEEAIQTIEEAGWVFAGPGSPSYLLRQWRGTRLPAALAERLQRPGAMVFASAAACTLGAQALPVYEIYKVGADPTWLEGFDLLRGVGLDAIVIPHFDNAEGGTHDTRYCYLGETRLRRLEEHLPRSTFVLGVDEHTAAVIDLGAGTLTVEGRGGVTVRRRGIAHVFPAGVKVPLEDVAAAGRGDETTHAGKGFTASRHDASSASVASRDGNTPFDEEVAEHEAAFRRALRDGDAIAAADAVIALDETIHAWAADTFQSDALARARRSLRTMVVHLGRVAAAGLHDHRDLLEPHVETLLDLRRSARDAGRYETADRIRDRLHDGGVKVMDRADGTEWAYVPDEDRTSADDAHDAARR